MKEKSIAVVLLMLLTLTIGCSAAVNAVTGDTSSAPVAQLWSDVPKMDGLAPSELELPLFAKVLMRTALNAFTGEGKNTGDWIVFTTTKAPDDVKNFYTNDRMTTFGWEPSENSTCLSGAAQGISQVGVFCVFEKKEQDKQTGLMIVAAPDEQTKQTDVFFVRVEERSTPAAQNQSTAITNPSPTQGAITMLNGPAPYGIEKRPMPIGQVLDQLLPKQVGPYTRTNIELSTNRNVHPTTIETDSNSVYATYRSNSGDDVFVEFALNKNAADAQSILDTAASETTDKFPTDPNFGSMGTEPSYLKVNNESGAFFAWTRGGYYFSASAKNGQAALDAFMQAFPY